MYCLSRKCLVDQNFGKFDQKSSDCCQSPGLSRLKSVWRFEMCGITIYRNSDQIKCLALKIRGEHRCDVF